MRPSLSTPLYSYCVFLRDWHRKSFSKNQKPDRRRFSQRLKTGLTGFRSAGIEAPKILETTHGWFFNFSLTCTLLCLLCAWYARMCACASLRHHVHAVMSMFTRSCPCSRGHVHVHAVMSMFTRSCPCSPCSLLRARYSVCMAVVGALK